MKCLACDSLDTVPLLIDRDGCHWRHCRACNSDTNEVPYNAKLYGPGFFTARRSESETQHDHLDGYDLNTEAFERHAGRRRGLALDVGCGNGASMARLWASGWDILGYDLMFAGRPKGIVVAPEFRAHLFWQRFDAVLCREVLEHVPDGRQLLRELFTVAVGGGLVQVTTPIPTGGAANERAYHRGHLCIWSLQRLQAELQAIGFEILEADIWELGQRYILRKGDP